MGEKVLTSSRDQIMLLAKLGYTTYTAKGMYLYSTQTCFCRKLPIIKVLKQIKVGLSKIQNIFPSISSQKIQLVCSSTASGTIRPGERGELILLKENPVHRHYLQIFRILKCA